LKVDSTEEVTEQGVKVCMLAVGDTHVELLEPLSPKPRWGKFLANVDRECITYAIEGRGHKRLACGTEKQRGTPHRRNPASGGGWMFGGFCSSLIS
jgi:hypothetical protein